MSKKNNNKKKKTTTPVKISNYFLMSQGDIDIKDINDAVKDEYETEIWPDSGIMEVLIAENGSMDFEEIEAEFEDDFSNDFLLKHNIQKVFYVTFKSEFESSAKYIMELICNSNLGFFCCDSPDFTPIIKKEE